MTRMDSSSSTSSDLPPAAPGVAAASGSGGIGGNANGNGVTTPRTPNGASGRPSSSSLDSPSTGLLGGVRDVLNSMPEDRTQWFLNFDDKVLKPVLLDRKR